MLLLLLPFSPFIDCLSSFSDVSYLCLLNVDVNEASFMIFFLSQPSILPSPLALCKLKMFEGVDDDEEDISGEDALLGCDEMKKRREKYGEGKVHKLCACRCDIQEPEFDGRWGSCRDRRASCRIAMTSSTGEACFASCSRLAFAVPPGVTA